MRKLFYDNVVIGSRLNAVIYAFSHGLPLLLTSVKKPSKVEYLEPANVAILGDLNSKPQRTRDGFKEHGARKLDVWNRLTFIMSAAGHIPFSNKISSIRVDEEKRELKVFTHNSRSIIIHCNRIIIFDDTNINGLPVPIQMPTDDDKRKVMDWISVRSGMVHPYDLFQTDSPFVNRVCFYPSDRIDGTHDKKDLVAISYLTKAELNEIEHSDLFVRYKVLDLMKEAGIRGRRNGRDPNNPDRYKHYAIKLETHKREVDLECRTLYNNTEFVEFNYQLEEELLKEGPPHLVQLYERLRGTV
jgi:hypothetical protein